MSILQQKSRTKRYMVDLKMFMCDAKIALILVIKKARGHNGRAIFKKQTNQNEKPQITQIYTDYFFIAYCSLPIYFFLADLRR